MGRIYAIGEALIDFIPTQHSVALKDVPGFLRAAGGAPANVAAAAAKLGSAASFVGMVGQDAFGEHLQETLQNAGVDTSYLYKTNQANTTLAFVSLKADGQREFAFYRNPGADMLLDAALVEDIPFAKEDILHFCSVCLVPSATRQAHARAIERIKAAGGRVCFDPNLRFNLWDDHKALKDTVWQFMQGCDVLKVSDEEIEFIFDTANEETAVQAAFDKGCQMVFVTKGSRGASVYTHGFSLDCMSPRVQAVDTTGAGDTFAGSMLSRLIALSPQQLQDPQAVGEVLRFAVFASAISVQNKGAIASMPCLEQVNAFLAQE